MERRREGGWRQRVGDRGTVKEDAVPSIALPSDSSSQLLSLPHPLECARKRRVGLLMRAHVTAVPGSSWLATQGTAAPPVVPRPPAISVKLLLRLSITCSLRVLLLLQLLLLLRLSLSLSCSRRRLPTPCLPGVVDHRPPPAALTHAPEPSFSAAAAAATATAGDQHHGRLQRSL